MENNPCLSPAGRDVLWPAQPYEFSDLLGARNKSILSPLPNLLVQVAGSLGQISWNCLESTFISYRCMGRGHCEVKLVLRCIVKCLKERSGTERIRAGFHLPKSFASDLYSRDRGLSSKTLCMESEQILPDGSRVRHYDVHSLYGWSQTRPTYEWVIVFFSSWHNLWGHNVVGISFLFSLAVHFQGLETFDCNCITIFIYETNSP